jgi:hypothetical protein
MSPVNSAITPTFTVGPEVSVQPSKDIATADMNATSNALFFMALLPPKAFEMG